MAVNRPTPNEANSLWRGGSRAFFKDQRAAQVSDIVSIRVSMYDTANVKHATTGTRRSAETAGAANFFGMEKPPAKNITDPSTLLSLNRANNNAGKGQIQRNQAVTIRVGGIVTRVLPNGNLVVAARQEFRVTTSCVNSKLPA
jgi:flagellar L-ring protein precursor FlgH